jgi:hypothetical protein
VRLAAELAMTWGKTRYGRRSTTLPINADTGSEATASRLPLGLKLFLAVIAAIVLVFVVAHLKGRGLGGHGM